MRVRDWKATKASHLTPGFALLLISFAAPIANAQSGQGALNQSAPLIQSVEGADLFHAYCASCHGAHGKGDGPVATSLKVAPPDLTRLSIKGQFPSDRVRKTILGDAVANAHGTRDMPIWGPVFHQIDADVDRGNVRVDNLVKYLESIQVILPSQGTPSTPTLTKASSVNSPSGAQLYKQFCSACHGNDLKGNGPAPPPFKDVPPDLTTLALRHGGKFPDDYVTSVLRNGVPIPAHAPPEMPTWDADFKAGYGLSEAQVSARIANLTNYIKSRQAK